MIRFRVGLRSWSLRPCSFPFDFSGAILSINAGEGTESCDWVSMIFRMYTRFAENHGYSVTTTDMLVGEEAGIKNITALIEGEYAYGYLKAERGVHDWCAFHRLIPINAGILLLPRWMLFLK